MFLLFACTASTTSPERPLNEPGDWLDEPDDSALIDSGEVLDDTGDSAPIDTGSPDLEPHLGSWIVTAGEVVEDGCGVDIGRGEAGATLELEDLGDQRIALTFSGGERVECALDGSDYLCDESESVDDTARSMGFDADLPVTLSTSGRFSAEDSMSMGTDVEIDCSGGDCVVLEVLVGNSFPCEMRIESALEAQ